MSVDPSNDFPKEFLFPIEGSPQFLARVTVNFVQGKFHSEVAILLEETRKIYSYIGSFYNFSDLDDCVKESLHRLAKAYEIL